jgi:hypothetical protein
MDVPLAPDKREPYWVHPDGVGHQLGPTNVCFSAERGVCFWRIAGRLNPEAP